MAYRVVYGETIAAWERIFPTLKEAEAFARKQRLCGDRVFSVKKVIPGEPPQSLAARIQSENAEMRDSPLKSRS